MKDAMAFEWSRARTVRSTWWCVAACVGLSVGIALLFGSVLRGAYDDMSPAGRAGFDPVGSGFNGLRLGMVALVAFGVLRGGEEHVSFLAVPRRGLLYAARVLTGTAIAAVVAAIVAVTTFVTAQAAIGAEHNAAWSDPGVPRAIVGAALYLTLLSAFAIGAGALIGNATVTLAVLVPLFTIVSEILNNLPGVGAVAQFLPDVAGGHILRAEEPVGTVLGHWSGLGVLLLWTVAVVLAGGRAVRRRDV
jgi:ABC-2 type transport system permease protein